MALEDLLNPKTVEKKPYVLILYTALCVTLAIFLSYNIFPEYSSVVLVSFTIIPLIPILVKIFELEELKLENFNPIDKKTKIPKMFEFFKKYSKLIKVYWYVFLTMVIAFSFWYTFLPDDTSQVLFQAQVDTLYSFDAVNAVYSTRLINGSFCDSSYLQSVQDTITDCKVIDLDKDGFDDYLIYENLTKPTQVLLTKDSTYINYGSYVRKSIFTHNFKILLFLLLTSFILGAGALFTLTWNASIVGVFVGEFANRIISLVGYLPFVKAPAYFIALPMSLFSIAVHGFFEFLAYFFAIFSGGMVSIAMMHHKFTDKKFIVILVESIVLFLVAILLLLLGSVIESII